MRAFPSVAWYELEAVVITALCEEERMLFLGDEIMLGELDLGTAGLVALNEIERRPVCLEMGDFMADFSAPASTNGSVGFTDSCTFFGGGVGARVDAVAGLSLQSKSVKPNPTSTEIG